jgi:hypothetical protein
MLAFDELTKIIDVYIAAPHGSYEKIKAAQDAVETLKLLIPDRIARDKIEGKIVDANTFFWRQHDAGYLTALAELYKMLELAYDAFNGLSIPKLVSEGLQIL